jgi:hypothetical protein
MLQKRAILAAGLAMLAACSDREANPLAAGPSLSSGTTIDVTTYGAVPGDNVDDSPAIASALLNADHVYIPGGRGAYKIDQQISVPAGKHIYGDGVGSLLDARGLTADVVGVFKVQGVTNNPNGILIEKLRFLGHGNGNHQAALRLTNSTNLTFRDNTADSISIASLDTASLVRIVNNKSVGPAGRWGGISLTRVDSIRADSNTIKTHKTGITWWGGDARTEPSHDASPDLATRIQIRHNVVENIFLTGSGEGACIWGSMGEDIEVSHNTVRTCDDVGLDAEGSDHVRFLDNKVYDVKSAALAVYHWSSNITFARNYVEQDGFGTGVEGSTLWTLVNPHMAASPTVANIRIHDNTFVYRRAGAGDPLVGQVTKNPTHSLYFVNNVLTNVVVDFGGCWSWSSPQPGSYCGGNGYMEVTGNRLNFESAVGNFSRDGIWVGHAEQQTWVDDNRVIAASSQSGRGIHLMPRSGTGHFARYNVISGFPVSLELDALMGSFFVDLNQGSGQFRCNGRPLLSNVGNSWGSVQPGC